MTAKNVMPTGAGVRPGDLRGEDEEGLTLPLTESGLVRVWLRWNVLGGRAGTWIETDPSNPDLPRLLHLNAVALPDPLTGEMLPPPTRPARSSCCRS